MAKSTKTLNIMLNNDLYKKIESIAKEEGITKSDLIMQALRQYVSNKRWINIREYGNKTARRLKISDEKDIENLLHKK